MSYVKLLELLLVIYASVNEVIIGLGNGFAPLWCQAIT